VKIEAGARKRLRLFNYGTHPPPTFPVARDGVWVRRMKTLTELGGSLIRMAAAAIADAKRSLPKEAPPAPAPAVEAAPQAEAPAEPVVEAAVEAAAEAAPEEGAPAEAAEPVAAAAAEPKKPAKKAEPVEEVESDAVKVALDAAVEKGTGLTGDRLARLRDAVKAVGNRTKDVRLVRVFGPEEPVPGAKTIGGFQYLVDFSPANMTQAVAAPKKERGGRGGGGGGGGGRGGGSGGGTKAGATGGFSMDSLREDRKGERRPGGRPGGGGGRKPGGSGGRPGGK